MVNAGKTRAPQLTLETDDSKRKIRFGASLFTEDHLQLMLAMLLEHTHGKISVMVDSACPRAMVAALTPQRDQLIDIAKRYDLGLSSIIDHGQDDEDSMATDSVN